MKKALSITAIAVVVIAGLPFAAGLVAKSRFQYLVEHARMENPNLVLSSTYHLGWLSSHATLSWTASIPQTTLPAIENDVVIHHGPITFFKDETGHHHFFFGVAVFDIQLPAFKQNPLFSIDFQKKEFSCLIRIPFSLHYNTRLAASVQATVNIAGKSILSFNLDKLLFDLNASHNLEHIRGQLLVENFNINADSKGYINIPKIQIDINHYFDHGVFLGDEHIEIPGIEMSAPPIAQFKMNTFTSSIKGTRDKDNVTYYMGVDLHNVSYNNQTYGPFTFDFQVSNLNFAALSQIQQKIQQYAQEKTKHPANNDTLQSTLNEDLKTLLPKLVQANTAITLKQLDFSIPAGSLRSDGYVHFSQALTSMSISSLMQNVEIHYHVSVDQALAQWIIRDALSKNIGAANNNIDPQPVLAQLIQVGLITQDNNTYNIDITLKQGIPYVNNKLFNPSMLLPLQTPPAVSAPPSIPAPTTAPVLTSPAAPIPPTAPTPPAVPTPPPAVQIQQ